VTSVDGLDSALWQPLLIVALIYAVLFVAGNVIEGRGDGKTADTVRDVAFGVILLGSLYTAGLIILSLISRPDLVGDMLLILAIIIVFFGLLVVVLYGAFGRLLPLLRRGSRVDVDPGDGKP
jgi:hypothetical protein